MRAQQLPVGRARTAAVDELRALLFGATVAAAIGPIALLIVSTGLRHGLAAALAAAAGAAAGDFAYAVAAFAAGSSIAGLLDRGRGAWALLAGTALLAMGTWIARAALNPPPSAAHPQGPARAGFAATYLLTLANPLTIFLFAGFSAQLELGGRRGDWLYFAALIFAGSFPVQAGYAALGASARRFASDARVIRGLNLASAAGIFAFGAWGIARAL